MAQVYYWQVCRKDYANTPHETFIRMGNVIYENKLAAAAKRNEIAASDPAHEYIVKRCKLPKTTSVTVVSDRTEAEGTKKLKLNQLNKFAKRVPYLHSLGLSNKQIENTLNRIKGG